jgi:hypothetical protein
LTQEQDQQEPGEAHHNHDHDHIRVAAAVLWVEVVVEPSYCYCSCSCCLGAWVPWTAGVASSPSYQKKKRHHFLLLEVAARAAFVFVRRKKEEARCCCCCSSSVAAAAAADAVEVGQDTWKAGVEQQKPEEPKKNHPPRQWNQQGEEDAPVPFVFVPPPLVSHGLLAWSGEAATELYSAGRAGWPQPQRRQSLLDLDPDLVGGYCSYSSVAPVAHENPLREGVERRPDSCWLVGVIYLSVLSTFNLASFLSA